MLNLIIRYGLIAGAVVGVPMFLLAANIKNSSIEHGELIGYTVMLVAFSTIFLAIKHRRDRDLGGVIKFPSALAIGLGITVIASLFYVAFWEAGLAIAGASPAAFLQSYIDAQAAQGIAPEKLAELRAMMSWYTNPFWRTLITLTEILPIGLLISFVSAGLLSFPRFLPARRANGGGDPA